MIISIAGGGVDYEAEVEDEEESEKSKSENIGATWSLIRRGTKIYERFIRRNPGEINAMIQSKMKETTEAFPGKKIKDAVISIPARIINEPTAFAIAFGLGKSRKADENKSIFHGEALCRKKKIPYATVKGKARLGAGENVGEMNFD
ncbi:hypothetical protein C5167_006077 [Papaver somniferum]|uniref:Uncharacterized protein n=1 Tax=Papaver somniferum TaxID=3469 RepID=A0A4Y7JG93_PAPSO|nr:hypothetical protein C5167_006077 [Papaver somniferum]